MRSGERSIPEAGEGEQVLEQGIELVVVEVGAVVAGKATPLSTWWSLAFAPNSPALR